jgi:FkbM family methyltransferase
MKKKATLHLFWQEAKKLLRQLLTSIFRFIFWLPFYASQYFRAAIFDSAKPNNLLLSNISDEMYLVSSSDKVIGRKTYIAGTFDFDKFEKVFKLLDTSFVPHTLIDIGANIGTICIPAVKRGLFSCAVAFEPDPFNYSLLNKNICINGLSEKIESYNLALGEFSNSMLEFELSENNFGDHRIRIIHNNGVNNESNRKTIQVRCETLDHFSKEINPKSTLIWMDTQGFEGFVLSGATQILQSSPPMVIEFWPYGMNRTGSYESLKNALCNARYTVFYDLDGDMKGTTLTKESLDNLFQEIGDDGDFTDLLFK